MMKKKQDGSLLRCVILCIQGAIVGTGAILPGISGGVLCVAFGIYEPMMALLSHPAKAFRKYFRMFLPFLAGWILGFVLLANMVELLFEASSSVMLMLFAGLIFGTIPERISKSQQSGARHSWTPFVLSLAAAYLVFCLLSGSSGNVIEANTFWFFFCGAVWGLSLVIPGLSSSSLLIFLGLYQPMTSGIAALDLAVILPLLGGLLLTVLLTARLVNRLFTNQYALISRIVLGIMTTSTLLILPQAFAGPLDFAVSLFVFAAGFLAARWMDICRTRQDREKHNNEEVL